MQPLVRKHLWAVVWAMSLAVSAVQAADAPAVPQDVQEAMQAKQYEAAVQAIEKHLAGKPKEADYLRYLKARAQHLDGKHREAVETFAALERDLPNSQWVRRARFGRAEALLKLRDLRGAEEIYEREVQYLLSIERKQEVAGIYLQFADTFYQPTEKNTEPNYQKAADYYRRALEVGPNIPRKAEVEFRIAHSLHKLGKHDQAEAAYRAFLHDHPQNVLENEARFLLGQAQFDQQKLADARRTWKDFLDAHPKPAEAPAAARPRLAEAAYLMSHTYGVPAPTTAEDLELGVAAAQRFIAAYPDHKLAPKAAFEVAQSYLRNFNRLEDAAKALTNLLKNPKFAQADEIPLARRELGHVYARQRKFDQAIVVWQEFLAKHPSHHLWSEVQQSIIDTEFSAGEDARAAKEYAQARKLWESFLIKYPLSPQAPNILLQFGLMLYDQEKYAEAIADWERLVSKYPGTEQASRGKFLIALTQEEQLRQFDESLKTYRALNWGRYQSYAAARVEQLTSQELAVVTPRVFRSGQKAVVQVTTRNIKQLQVKAYRIDMETYFRKMHLARGIESLDVALIDPDKSWTFEIPEYADHQQLASEIEIPLDGPGVMAVTIANEPKPIEKPPVGITVHPAEATTMVVVSDLDVLVKCSRNELFVYTQNMKTGKPQPQVKLLVSDGEKVFAEAQTNDDGVFIGTLTDSNKTFEPLRNSKDIRVFAVSSHAADKKQDDQPPALLHVASSVVGINGLEFAQGLAPQGFLYTDRPAYRSGHEVHVRGLIRWVKQDRFHYEPGKKLKLDVVDSQGRMLRTQDVTLGEFGTFGLSFPLPQDSALGEYSLHLHDPAEPEVHDYHGSFLVQEYQLEPVQISMETPRKVYYRGEEISGVIRLRYYYGLPLADREVHFYDAESVLHKLRTNDAGEAEFKFDTRPFREDQTLSLSAQFPERGIGSRLNIFLATRAFKADVQTARDVYITGETFDVTVTTLDAAGDKTGQEMTLSVFEQTLVRNQTGEKLVSELKCPTDKTTGVGRVTVKLDKAARYILRTQGTDRFGNPVSAEKFVTASGEEDAVRLRILADKHHFRAGDEAQVNLHWRDAPAMALVTFQGAKVLGYKLVPLKTGLNPLPLLLEEKLAPNFDLNVSVMSDTGGERRFGDAGKPENRAKLPQPKAKPLVLPSFHEASSSFEVSRPLTVTIEPSQASIEPGKELEVKITTRDPQGRPIAAELSLALVEQNLLNRFANRLPQLAGSFENNRRSSSLRTATSCTFRYAPATRAINYQLLAEAERLAVADMERASRERPADEPAALAMGEVMEEEIIEEALQMEQLALVEVELSDLGLDNAPDTELLNTLGTTMGRGYSSRNGLITRYGGMAQQQLRQQTRQMPRQMDGAGNRDFQDRYHANDVNGNVDFQTGRWGFMPQGGANGPGSGLFSAELGLVINQTQNVAEPEAEIERYLAETAYWNPSIVTDKNGQAVVKFAAPPRSSAWTFSAVGISQETLVGQSSAQLVTMKNLFGELTLPLAFTDGDTARITATVHNNVVEKGTLNVTLKTTIADKVLSETKKVDVTSKGLQEVTFERTMTGTGEAKFELSVTAGEAKDELVRTAPLRPYGLTVYATTGGTADANMTAWLSPPKEMELRNPNLSIIIGPGVERSLLAVVLGGSLEAKVYQDRLLICGSALERTTSDVLAVAGLLQLFEQSREQDAPQRVELTDRGRSAISYLVSTQNDDGGWSWTGGKHASDRDSTARVLWSLSVARRASFAVPETTFQRAVEFVQGKFTAARETDYRGKAVMLHALTAAGHADFAYANRLYRSRQSLSSESLAYLALTFTDMDRKEIARELLDLLAKKTPMSTVPAANDGPARQGNEQLSGLGVAASGETEVLALALLAWQRVATADAAVKNTAERLLALRSGARWHPERATGPATLALSDYFARTKSAGEKYELAVFVNDERVALLNVSAADGSQVIEVPAALLKRGEKIPGQGDPRRQRIQFEMKGRGRFTYQCVLSGFVAAEGLKSTSSRWSVSRIVEAAPLEMDGREVPRGFDLVEGNYRYFRNTVTQLPVGKRALVHLNMTRQSGTGNDEELDYLVVTEPLPAGATLVDGSVKGKFERFEVGPGYITFYLGNERYPGSIQFEVFGYAPGAYRTAPSVVRSYYNPQEMAVSKVGDLSVLAAGQKSKDEYKLTPREMYELGKRSLAKKDYPAAGAHLTQLFDTYRLRTNEYRETAQMLLEVSLKQGKPAEIVRYFEILKEKFPELEIVFEQIFLVGKAYRDMDEYERAYLVFRATAEASFHRESQVAGFLDSQNEFLRSVEVMDRLLREYPAEPYIASATYALAQQLYAKAPEVAGMVALRAEGITRIDFVRQAIARLDNFLTVWPDDPAADEASFSLASGYVELEHWKTALERAEKFASRYPKSKFLDSFWYIMGYSHFALGQHQQALKVCQQVVEATHRDPNTGREEESNNKHRAQYIIGQIHHSLGQAAQAVANYRKVEDRFADAHEAIEYFTRKDIALPEVTTIRPGDKAEVKLKYRNVSECEVKVYRIDLMKFSLLQRDLSGITRINLSGIRPLHESKIALGDGKDYEDKKKQLELPLEKEGAYLIVCRGDNLHTSGLALVTPLEVEVQEQATSGRVRATVKNAVSGKYAASVEVKIVGSHDEKFRDGRTDLRGVFVADNVCGRSTVIARADSGQYAFYRGEQLLGAVPEQPNAPAAPENIDKPREEGLLEDLLRSNRDIQGENSIKLQELYQNKKQGVQTKAAY